ncbi:hypothetical protein ElyMa_004088300 [Elysia marginata]|uniref:Uncharacterized protein n=1 Tax=Elysia marginata TaxID=1093978 RepID=A0AAV4GC81_9GAST|nr:hypothetical protein ElyMa_004088300 [Elysia marginata]
MVRLRNDLLGNYSVGVMPLRNQSVSLPVKMSFFLIMIHNLSPSSLPPFSLGCVTGFYQVQALPRLTYYTLWLGVLCYLSASGQRIHSGGSRPCVPPFHLSSVSVTLGPCTEMARGWGGNDRSLRLARIFTDRVNARESNVLMHLRKQDVKKTG